MTQSRWGWAALLPRIGSVGAGRDGIIASGPFGDPLSQRARVVVRAHGQPSGRYCRTTTPPGIIAPMPTMLKTTPPAQRLEIDPCVLMHGPLPVRTLPGGFRKRTAFPSTVP